MYSIYCICRDIVYMRFRVILGGKRAQDLINDKLISAHENTLTRHNLLIEFVFSFRVVGNASFVQFFFL